MSHIGQRLSQIEHNVEMQTGIALMRKRKYDAMRTMIWALQSARLVRTEGRMKHYHEYTLLAHAMRRDALMADRDLRRAQSKLYKKGEPYENPSDEDACVS